MPRNVCAALCCSTAPAKQAVFAQLITRCGQCHAALGLRLPLGGANPEQLPAARTETRKRVVISADKIVITEKIQFDVEAATIKPESHGLLDEITAVIQSNPQLRKISIEGHTDSDGAAEYNLELSRERAAAVQRYLTQHGIEAARLTSRGFGGEQPIASNDQAEGKEANRRVEFRIVEQAAAERSYEVDPATGAARER